jgi:hypothetical protein
MSWVKHTHTVSVVVDRPLPEPDETLVLGQQVNATFEHSHDVSAVKQHAHKIFAFPISSIDKG